MSDLHDRIAKALGWSAADVRSLSMQSLRDLVRPVDPALARELDYVIQSGAYIRGPRASRRSRGSHHATIAAPGGKTNIWKRIDWTAPGASAPFKYDWEHVRDASSDNAEAWLAIFRRDDPDAVFVASPTKPRAKKGPKIMRGPGFTY